MSDLISREALKQRIEAWEYYGIFSKSYLIDIIDTAPTVEPRIEYGTDGQPYRLNISNGKEFERPQGEWLCITKSTFPQYQPDEYKCSQCNKLCHIKYYFCPFCGADMRGDNNG